ncbi:hypothetical protein AAY473_028660 [Plecturocebus cupreus]
MPVVPATREAEAGELLELTRQRLQILLYYPVVHFGRPRPEDPLRSGVRDKPSQHGLYPLSNMTGTMWVLDGMENFPDFTKVIEHMKNILKRIQDGRIGAAQDCSSQ